MHLELKFRALYDLGTTWILFVSFTFESLKVRTVQRD